MKRLDCALPRTKINQMIFLVFTVGLKQICYNYKMSSTSTSTSIRFYPGLDIALLKEVAAINPYGKEKHAKEWDSIVDNVNSTLKNGKTVTPRGCKDRMKTLLKAHRKAEMQSLKA